MGSTDTHTERTLPVSENPYLSICVIGRNEERNILRAMRSIEHLRTVLGGVEIIFVDSNSSDMSARLALDFADEVIELEPSVNLCASAGRHVGTLRARGEWILYLDADMALRPEFVSDLLRIRDGGGAGSGWVGERTDIYDSGGLRHDAMSLPGRGRIVSQFGGAVLLPRDCVLRAGNWNPRIFSNEEIELYARLRQIGCVVRSTGSPMVDHHTQSQGWSRKLQAALLGNPALGRKSYGIGQVLAAQHTLLRLANLTRYFPEPFVYWAGIGSAAVLAAIKLRKLSVAVLLSAVLYVWRKKGLQFVAVYSGFGPQALIGYLRYDRRYDPVVKRVLTGSMSTSP